MAEFEQITLTQWQQWKEDIRQKLAETAQNFVYIGYRLKQIRDSGMLPEGQDIFAFANQEYGLGKSTVSRFIAINEKFSVDGNSLELRQEFKAISSSKLSEMLTLSDEDCELITEHTTVKEIRELKEFNKQDPEEVERTEALEEQNTGLDMSIFNPLQKCIISMFDGKKDVLLGAIQAAEKLENYTANESESMDDIAKRMADLINPSGNGSVQKGTIYLFMYDYDTGIKYRDMTRPQVNKMTYIELAAQIYQIYKNLVSLEDENKIYEYFYEQKKEEKNGANLEVEKTSETAEILDVEAVATSQQNKGSENEKTDRTDIEQAAVVEENGEEETKEEEEDLSLAPPEVEDDIEDTATTEEEKKNAAKLHVLKMLEKYYTYLMDDEKEILDRILEDCKRRKREYGFDDVGSTL